MSLSVATPTRAAICLRFGLPSSGSSANGVRVRMRPTPGTLRSKFSSPRQSGGSSKPPVASIAIKAGDSACKRLTRLRITYLLVNHAPSLTLGRTATSSVALDTSVSTQTGPRVMSTSFFLARPCTMRAWLAQTTVRALLPQGVMAHAYGQSRDQGLVGLRIASNKTVTEDLLVAS